MEQREFNMDQDLLEQYKMLHKSPGNTFLGLTLRLYGEEIREHLIKHDVKTLIDYGCGQAMAHPEINFEGGGVNLTLYDPAVERYSAKPQGIFDAAICTDVLEHIPEEDLDEVISDLDRYGSKMVFVTVCCRKAKQILPDGRNAHVTVKPEEWWLEKLPDRFIVRFTD